MAEPRYLLDSNICIYILDRVSSEAVLRLEQCETGEAVTSAIVYAEVMLGAMHEGKGQQARRLFDVVPVLPFDVGAADRYAKLAFKRNSFDRLIAAHALQLGLTVVTSNRRHFAGLQGLKVEDWTQ